MNPDRKKNPVSNMRDKKNVNMEIHKIQNMDSTEHVANMDITRIQNKSQTGTVVLKQWY